MTEPTITIYIILNYFCIVSINEFSRMNQSKCMFWCYSKTCLKLPLKIRQNKGLKDKWLLNEGWKYCRMLFWSILQYFWPALSDNLSWKPILGHLFEWPLQTCFTVLRDLSTISLSNTHDLVWVQWRIARRLKKLRTSKGDHWIQQWFSSISSLFKMGTSLTGKNLLSEGANSFL